jgi:hypothetical protein
VAQSMFIGKQKHSVLNRSCERKKRDLACHISHADDNILRTWQTFLLIPFTKSLDSNLRIPRTNMESMNWIIYKWVNKHETPNTVCFLKLRDKLGVLTSCLKFLTPTDEKYWSLCNLYTENLLKLDKSLHSFLNFSLKK